MRLRNPVAAAGLALMAAVSFAQQIPRPANEFAVSMNDGSQILLSQYPGKVVLLVFLFTT